MTMNLYTISDITTSSERYKLYILMSNHDKLSENITFIQSQNIPVINIGLELARYIDSLENFRYLNIEAYEYTKKLLEDTKSKIGSTGNDVVAIYNLGILQEPKLEINTVQLLKEFSKSSALIIIWENLFDTHQLNWPTQKNKFFLDFHETQLKKLQYAI